MTNFPFAEVSRKAAILSSQGMDVFQKFTCVRCERRVTLKEPNIFLSRVACNRCGAVNDITKTGCNYEIRNDVAARR